MRPAAWGREAACIPGGRPLELRCMARPHRRRPPGTPPPVHPGASGPRGVLGRAVTRCVAARSCVFRPASAVTVPIKGAAVVLWVHLSVAAAVSQAPPAEAAASPLPAAFCARGVGQAPGPGGSD